jgi:tripartite-type tricarboxylate transporter receptor subunit TctC
MRSAFAILGVLSIAVGSAIGMAADFPNKPIRMIIPYSAGGGTDVLARAFQPALEKALGQRVLIENIPAGSTKIGTMELMKAKPDGYTLIFSATEPWVIAYHSGTFESKVWEQMVPVGNVTSEASGVIEVRTESPFKTWEELAKAAKENPGKISCGGSPGGINELVYNAFTKAAGIKMVYVPFSGGGASKIALLGGHIDTRTATLPEAITMVRDGTTRVLAVSTEKRHPVLPAIRTFKELGIGEAIELTRSIWGPPKLPSDLVNTLTKMIEKATKDPEFIKIAQDQLLYTVDYRAPERMKATQKQFETDFGPRLVEMYKK